MSQSIDQRPPVAVGHVRLPATDVAAAERWLQSVGLRPIFADDHLAVLERCDGFGLDVVSLSRSAHRFLAHEALWVAVRAYDRRRTGWVPVDDLVAFAFDCWPDTASLGIYHTLQLRRSIGPRITPYLQPLVWSAVIREFRNGYRRYTWPRRGF